MKILDKMPKLWDMSKLKVKTSMPGMCNSCHKNEKYSIGMCESCYLNFLKKYK